MKERKKNEVHIPDVAVYLFAWLHKYSKAVYIVVCYCEYPVMISKILSHAAKKNF
jgi:hypothetical protein